MKMFEHLFHPTSQHWRDKLRWISVFLCVCGLFGAAPAAQEPTKEPAKREMTDEEKVASWKGEKVILTSFGSENLLSYAGVKCPGRRGDSCPCYRRYDRPQEGLPINQYAGKTGVIIEASPGAGHVSGQIELVIRLDDSGEKIAGCDYNQLGFFGEREAASAVIGRPLWAIGSQRLARLADLQKSSYEGGRIVVKNIQKVTATRVEWGEWPYPLVILCVKTEAGEEGCADQRRRGSCFDSRFHLSQDAPCTGPFYLEDPHKRFPGWSKVTWELIENEKVAIGMTEDMVRLTCGAGLIRIGAILSGAEEVSPIYSCGDNRFIVEKGKVKNYYEPQR